MDINTLRGLSTLFLFLAFMGLVFWAYSSKRKKEFEDAANLPFADDIEGHQVNEGSGSNQEKQS